MRITFSSPVKRGRWIDGPDLSGAERRRGRKAADATPLAPP